MGVYFISCLKERNKMLFVGDYSWVVAAKQAHSNCYQVLLVFTTCEADYNLQVIFNIPMRSHDSKYLICKIVNCFWEISPSIFNVLHFPYALYFAVAGCKVCSVRHGICSLQDFRIHLVYCYPVLRTMKSFTAPTHSPKRNATPTALQFCDR